MWFKSRFDVRNIFGKRCFQYFAALTGSLSILSSDMHFGWSSPALPILTNGSYFFQISSEEASWLAVILFPGIVSGAILSIFLADTFGRKKIILGAALPLFFSWLILGLARSDLIMFVARFMGGVGGGLSFATVPMYLGEISDPEIRGFLSSLCPVFVVVSILLINVLGIYLPLDMSALISCGIPILMFCTFIWMPESPVLLFAKGKYDLAKESLKILRGDEDGEKEFSRLSKELEETLQDQPGANDRLIDLFRVPENMKALLIALGLRSVQQICGSTAITFYCKTIFQENESFMTANVATIIYFSLQAVLAMGTSFIIDIVGRRPMFIFSLAGTTLTLFIVGAYMLVEAHSNLDLSSYNSMPVISLLLNVSFFSMGVRNVPLLVISEIFHPKIKPLALCFVTIYYAILAIVVTKFYHVTTELIEMAFPMFAFGIMSLVALIIYYFFVPETKGKSLEDIQKMLKNKSC